MTDDSDSTLKVAGIWRIIDEGRDLFKSALPLIDKCLEEGNREAYKCFTWIEPALLNVGNFDDVEEFDKTRIRILNRAAELYVSSACYELALEYEKGLEVSKDLEKAFDYMERAAALDHRGACFKLATYLLEGVGCQVCIKNQREAAKVYYHLAFTLNHFKALFDLAKMALFGLALPKDASFAFVLASCARAHGEDDSQNLLGKIEHALSAEEKAQAEDIACRYSSSRALKILGSFPQWIRTEPDFYKNPEEAKLRQKAMKERERRAAHLLVNILSNEENKNGEIESPGA
jgi:hypothetical protein